VAAPAAGTMWLRAGGNRFAFTSCRSGQAGQAGAGGPGQEVVTGAASHQAPAHLCCIRRFGYHKSQKAIISPREGYYAVLPYRNVPYVQLAPKPRHRDQAT